MENGKHSNCVTLRIKTKNKRDYIIQYKFGNSIFYKIRVKRLFHNQDYFIIESFYHGIVLMLNFLDYRIAKSYSNYSPVYTGAVPSSTVPKQAMIGLAFKR